MKPNIGITEKNREKVAGILNVLIADEFVLYTKTLNFHWNLCGPSFLELHELLDKQYNQLQQMIDLIAERTRQLGEDSAGTLKEFLQKTRLKESLEKPPAIRMLKILLTDHETVISELRKDVKDCDKKYEDQGTTDFLTGLMKDHEKMAWMLRSYLE